MTEPDYLRKDKGFGCVLIILLITFIIIIHLAIPKLYEITSTLLPNF